MNYYEEILRKDDYRLNTVIITLSKESVNGKKETHVPQPATQHTHAADHNGCDWRPGYPVHGPRPDCALIFNQIPSLLHRTIT